MPDKSSRKGLRTRFCVPGRGTARNTLCRPGREGSRQLTNSQILIQSPTMSNSPSGSPIPRILGILTMIFVPIAMIAMLGISGYAFVKGGGIQKDAEEESTAAAAATPAPAASSASRGIAPRPAIPMPNRPRNSRREERNLREQADFMAVQSMETKPFISQTRSPVESRTCGPVALRKPRYRRRRGAEKILRGRIAGTRPA